MKHEDSWLAMADTMEEHLADLDLSPTLYERAVALLPPPPTSSVSLSFLQYRSLCACMHVDPWITSIQQSLDLNVLEYCVVNCIQFAYVHIAHTID